MASCTSTFGEADYDCSGQGSLTASFEVTPASFSHDPNIPDQAIVTFDVNSALTVSNIKYSDTTDQDISAWVALTSGTTPLAESDKTFVPREDCATTSNNLSTTSSLNIVAGDAVKFKGKWSGVDGSEVGIDVANCDWNDVELGDSFTITPPQNLQVTFPNTFAGTVSWSLSSWSKNPNIGSAPFSPPPGSSIQYNNWNILLETIDNNGNIVNRYPTTHTDSSLSSALTTDTTNTKPNSKYRLRLTASNAYQATTSVISPEVYTRPPQIVLRRPITYQKNEDGTWNAIIDWSKGRDGGALPEQVWLTTSASSEPQLVGAAQNGESISSTATVSNLSPGVRYNYSFSDQTLGSSYAGGTTGYLYPPADIPSITTIWNDAHTCLNISATAPNIQKYRFKVGYSPTDTSLIDTYTANGITSVQICNLNPGDNKVIYISATPINSSDDYEYSSSTAYTTTEILRPILGVAKDCDKALNVIDIVETHSDGTMTPQWQSGTRVVKRTC